MLLIYEPDMFGKGFVISQEMNQCVLFHSIPCSLDEKGIVPEIKQHVGPQASPQKQTSRIYSIPIRRNDHVDIVRVEILWDIVYFGTYSRFQEAQVKRYSSQYFGIHDVVV
jgi:hypothetical protein